MDETLVVNQLAADSDFHGKPEADGTRTDSSWDNHAEISWNENNIEAPMSKNKRKKSSFTTFDPPTTDTYSELEEDIYDLNEDEWHGEHESKNEVGDVYNSERMSYRDGDLMDAHADTDEQQDTCIEQNEYHVILQAGINKLRRGYDRFEFFITSQMEKTRQFLNEIRSERDELDKLELKLSSKYKIQTENVDNSWLETESNPGGKTDVISNGEKVNTEAYRNCNLAASPIFNVLQKMTNHQTEVSMKPSTIHQKHPLSDIRHSKVWQYFDKIDDDRNVQCKVKINGMTHCNKVLKYHRNTTVMLRHIKAFHKDIRLGGNSSSNSISFENVNMSHETSNMTGSENQLDEHLDETLDDKDDENEESIADDTESHNVSSYSRSESFQFSSSTNSVESRHSNTSIVWKHFEKIDNNLNIQCKVIQNGAHCNKILRFHKNTTSMLNHLRSFHKHLTIDYSPLSTSQNLSLYGDNKQYNYENGNTGVYSDIKEEVKNNYDAQSSYEDGESCVGSEQQSENQAGNNSSNSAATEPLANELVESASIADFRQSKVWKYFEKMGNEASVQCKVLFNGVQCNQILAYDNRNTSAMLTHLKSTHKHLNMDEPMQAPPNSKLHSTKPKVLLRKDVECNESQDTNVSNFFKVQINNLSTIKFYASKLNKRSSNGTQMFYFDCSQNRSHLKCPCKMYVIYNYHTNKGSIYRSLEYHNHD